MFLHFTDSQTTGYVNFRPHAAEVLSAIAKWDLSAAFTLNACIIKFDCVYN